MRSLRSTAVNYGDTLVEVVCGTASIGDAVPMEVRFAAALQLEGMATRGGWDEAKNFSDKPLITKRLMEVISGSTAAIGIVEDHPYTKRLMHTLVRCVAQMCALEYTTMSSPSLPRDGGVWSPWEAYVDDCLRESLTGESGNDQYTWNCRALLHHAATLGRHNTMLWKVLANRGIQCCHAAIQEFSQGIGAATFLDHPRRCPTSSSCPRLGDAIEFVIKLASALASKPPVDPHVFESALFGAEFMQWMTTTTQTYVGLEALWSAADEDAVVAGCELSIQCLTFMIHAPKREPTHRPLLCGIISTLTTMGESYLLVVASLAEASRRGESLHALITEMLESVQAILDALPAAFEWVHAPQLFHALLWFMVDEEAAEDVAAEEEALVAAMESDDTVLAGCGSGSPRAVATSLVQLFLEDESDTLFDFVDAWAAVALQIGVAGGTLYWSALCSVMIAMAHQTEISNTSLYDTIGDCTTEKVLSPMISRIAHDSTTPLLRGRLLYSLGCVMAQSTNVGACNTVFHYLVQVIESESQRVGGQMASTAACVALHAACSILTTSPLVCQHIASAMPPMMMDCALWVASSAGSLGSYCGGFAINKLIDVADHLCARMWSSGRIATAVEGIVAHCTTGSKGKALATLVVALLEEHVSLLPGTDQAPQEIVSRCRDLQQVMSTIHQAATQDASATSSVVMRCLFETLPTMLQWYHTKYDGLCETAAKACQTVPADWCTCQPMLAALVKTVSTFAASHGPHDDPTLRALCVALGNALAVDGMADSTVANVAVAMFQSCAPPHEAPSSDGAVVGPNGYSLLTVANASQCLAIAAMHQRTPSFFSEDAMRTFLCGISLRKSKWKDANNAGLFLYPAMCAAFNPTGSLAPLLMAVGASPPLPAATDLLGLWASIIALADRRTQLYTLIAWHRLLEHIFLGDVAATDTARHFATSATPNCTFRKLKGLHEKDSRLTIQNCSPLQAILYGLSEVCYSNVRSFAKLTSFTHHSVFDALMSPNRHESIHSDPFCRELLQCTSSEGALKILQHWGEAVPDMRQMISAAATVITSST